LQYKTGSAPRGSIALTYADCTVGADEGGLESGDPCALVLTAKVGGDARCLYLAAGSEDERDEWALAIKTELLHSRLRAMGPAAAAALAANEAADVTAVDFAHDLTEEMV
jgi:hypothetical protein